MDIKTRPTAAALNTRYFIDSYGIEDLIVGWASDNYLGIFLQDPSDANFDLRIDNIEELIVPEELDFASTSSID